MAVRDRRRPGPGRTPTTTVPPRRAPGRCHSCAGRGRAPYRHKSECVVYSRPRAMPFAELPARTLPDRVTPDLRLDLVVAHASVVVPRPDCRRGRAQGRTRDSGGVPAAISARENRRRPRTPGWSHRRTGGSGSAVKTGSIGWRRICRSMGGWPRPDKDPRHCTLCRNGRAEQGCSFGIRVRRPPRQDRQEYWPTNRPPVRGFARTGGCLRQCET